MTDDEYFRDRARMAQIQHAADYAHINLGLGKRIFRRRQELIEEQVKEFERPGSHEHARRFHEQSRKVRDEKLKELDKKMGTLTVLPTDE